MVPLAMWSFLTLVMILGSLLGKVLSPDSIQSCKSFFHFHPCVDLCSSENRSYRGTLYKCHECIVYLYTIRIVRICPEVTDHSCDETSMDICSD
ncbi:unnamed protein product [Fusarium graminearum]|nr:unnamed protein product [Fusarium graminearum]